MPDNELLIEKWETQRKMAEEAGYSIKKMLDNAEKIVAEIEREYSIVFKYSTRKPSRIRKKII